MNHNWRQPEKVVKGPTTEQQLQVKCNVWFDNEYPDWRGMLHMNDNNSGSLLEGNIKKAMGVRKGVSDLELIAEAGTVWFIELKLPGGVQSKEQIDFMNKVKARGHIYIIIYSFEEFKKLICEIIGR